MVAAEVKAVRERVGIMDVTAFTKVEVASALEFEEVEEVPVTVRKPVTERITYRAGGPELVATMQANGGYAALVSGGFTAFTTAVAIWMS